MAVWTLSPSLADPYSFLQSPLRSGLSARHHSLSPLPQTHRNFHLNALCFLGGGVVFFFFGAVSTVPLLTARPHPVFLLEVSAVTNRREAGVYSASALGVMGAMEPHPLWPDPRQLQTAQPSTVCSSPLLNAKNRAVQSWSESPSGL